MATQRQAVVELGWQRPNGDPLTWQQQQQQQQTSLGTGIGRLSSSRQASQQSPRASYLYTPGGLVGSPRLGTSSSPETGGMLHRASIRQTIPDRTQSISATPLPGRNMVDGAMSSPKNHHVLTTATQHSPSVARDRLSERRARHREHSARGVVSANRELEVRYVRHTGAFPDNP